MEFINGEEGGRCKIFKESSERAFPREAVLGRGDKPGRFVLQKPELSAMKDEWVRRTRLCFLLAILFLQNRSLTKLFRRFVFWKHWTKRKQSIRFLPLFLADSSSRFLLCFPRIEIFVYWQSCKRLWNTGLFYLQVYGDPAFGSTTNLQRKYSANVSLLGTSHKFNYAYIRENTSFNNRTW